MSSLNMCQIIGNLGQDPEIRATKTGTTVCTLSVATTEFKKAKDGSKGEKVTNWHRIVCWDKTADICAQYLRKGSKAYFQGPIRTREWQDEHGQKRYTTEITANRMLLLDKKDDGAKEPFNSASSRSGDESSFLDDIPF